MNWLGVFAIALGFAGYILGLYCARKVTTRISAFLATFIALVLAIPAIVYDIYYAKVLGEPIWLYRIRVVPGSEILASLAGLSAAWVQGRMVPHLKWSSLGRRFLVPVVFGFAIALPYLKPLFAKTLHQTPGWKTNGWPRKGARSPARQRRNQMD